MGADDRRELTEEERVALAARMRPTLQAARFVELLMEQTPGEKRGGPHVSPDVRDAEALVTLAARALAGQADAAAVVKRLAGFQFGTDRWSQVRRLASMIELDEHTGRPFYPAHLLIQELAARFPEDQARFEALDAGQVDEWLGKIGQHRRVGGLTVAGVVARILVRSGALGFEGHRARLARLEAAGRAEQAAALATDFAREVSRALGSRRR